MGRPRKPKTLHDLEGTKSEANTGVAPLAALADPPPPPKHLDKAAKAEWRRLAAEIVPNGFLTAADLAIFESYCIAFSDVRRLRAKVRRVGEIRRNNNDTLSAHPAVALLKDAEKRLHSCIGKLGFSPADRAKVRDMPTAPGVPLAPTAPVGIAAAGPKPPKVPPALVLAR